MTSPRSAIVGMACVFPGAPDLDTFWRNVREGYDAIGEAPPERLDPVYFDERPGAPAPLYCRRGGFVDEHAYFDPLRFGIMPAAADGAEPDQLLALRLASEALEDAGYANGREAPTQTSVILGRGGYIGAGTTRLEQHVRGAQQLAEGLRSLLPQIERSELDGIKTAFRKQLSRYGSDTAIGLVPNLAASRIANRLDLGGSAYTVDAACASSLLAVGHAHTELAMGQADLAIAGGVHLANNEAFWSVFCELGALSPSEQIRPFHRDADGLLIGEGIGVVVLKRLDDAIRDGDRIYASIAGVGTASDGRSATLMTPAVDGQLRALERAWLQTARSRDDVDLIEAHGTATPAGDAAELETLGRFFGPLTDATRAAALGSVKSMIGHTMPAAGAAGLIKAALALHHSTLPPTLHCDDPSPAVEQTRFRPLSEAQAWEDPRLAGVNAFGFGGINAHVVLEAAPRLRDRSGSRRSRGPRRDHRSQEAIFVAMAPSKAELLAVLDGRAASSEGRWRIAVVDPTRERLGRARAAVESGRSRRGRDGIYFATEGLLAAGRGKLAFVFPGVEAEFEPRLDDVAEHFDLALARFDADDLESRGFGVFETGRVLNLALEHCGVRPDAIAGHSIGEWSGMIAAGVVADEDVDAFLATLRPGSLEVPGFAFAALGCGADAAQGALEGLEDVVVSHDNCPHQSVVCGRRPELEIALERLRSKRVLGQLLEYPEGGFHTRFLADHLSPYRDALDVLPLRRAEVPLWSATTCATYPDDADEIRALALRHLVEPVRFRELVERLYAEGVRAFVQVGTGNVVGFVDDTLRGRECMAIAANVPRASGLSALRSTVAALFVEGHDVDLAAAGLSLASSHGDVLRLAVPLVRLAAGSVESLAETRARPAAELSQSAADTPVAQAIDALISELAETRELALSNSPRRERPAGRSRPADTGAAPATSQTDLVEQIRISVATHPELLGHCLFPQPDGWPDVSDRYPVVPMTMSVELLVDAARRVSGLEVVELEHIRASRWLAAEPTVDVTVRARFDGVSRVALELEGYVAATALVAAGFPEASDNTDFALTEGGVPPVRLGSELYDDRWMFHGPAYQGVVSIDQLGNDGISGVLAPLPAPGALLDAAGQLFGYWIMATEEKDRLSMPVRIERIAFYGPPSVAGELVNCVAKPRSVGEQSVTGDLELSVDGRVVTRIWGWQDWRFQTDERLWQVMRRPESNLLSTRTRDGYFTYALDERSARSHDYLTRRYLNARERAVIDGLPEARRSEWLSGRIAAKDAVRQLLFAHGHEAVYPAELTILADEQGRPVVETAFEPSPYVSIAHKGARAVALAQLNSAPGIDIEIPGEVDLQALTRLFAPAELAAVPAVDEEWVTRMWSAREAAGKSRGDGLAGTGRHLSVEAIDGQRVRVAGQWIETRHEGGVVVAWTT